MKNFKTPLFYIGFILLSIYSNPVYSQYCYNDTITVTGELGGETIVENRIIKAENATVSSDGALIGADAIILLPNFEVEAGVNFTASVIDCRGTKPYITIPEENAIMDNGCIGSNNSDMLDWYFEWNEVAGATQYQLFVTIPGAPHPAINRTTTNTHYTHLRNTSFIGNAVRGNWEASVRALVDGVWTPWYGGQGDEPLKFSVEPVNTDCPPLITAPLPQATLDNGCNAGEENMNWYFEWTEIEGATEYQLIIQHPSVGVNTFNEIVTTNSWTLSQNSIINTYFTGWTAKVRAKVDGLWSDYHGSTIDEEVLLFNLEPADTDCVPIVTTPAPQAILDNGCLEGDATFGWEFIFDLSLVPNGSQNQARINRPDGSSYFVINLGTESTIVNIYEIFTTVDFFPETELNNWSVQVRSNINGAWTNWYGHTPDESATYFNLEPPNTCIPLIVTPQPQAVIENGCYNVLGRIVWEFEWTAVSDASEYEILVKLPNGNTYFNEVITGDLTSVVYIENGEYVHADELDNWSVQVRAKVDNTWTDWYGHSLDEDQTYFNVGPPRECAPIITTPISNAVLDNGCDGFSNTMDWQFEWTPVLYATEYQLIIAHPNLTVNTFNEIVTTNSWSYNELNQISTHYTGWTAKVRAKVNDVWTDYHGSTLDEEVLLFDVEPKNTDCANLVSTVANNRTSSNSQLLKKSVDFKVHPNPFQQKTTIEYSVSKASNIHLGVYTLTGKLITVLASEAHQIAGNYSTTFEANNDLPIGMYWIRLQIGDVIQVKKIVLGNE